MFATLHCHRVGGFFQWEGTINDRFELTRRHMCIFDRLDVVEPTCSAPTCYALLSHSISFYVVTIVSSMRWIPPTLSFVAIR
jgi:hypothetical protein